MGEISSRVTANRTQIKRDVRCCTVVSLQKAGWNNLKKNTFDRTDSWEQRLHKRNFLQHADPAWVRSRNERRKQIKSEQAGRGHHEINHH